MSRAYYAAYSWITHELTVQGMSKFGRYQNPDHNDLPKLIRNNLSAMSFEGRRQLSQAVVRLRKFREDADYRPRANVDGSARLLCLRDLGSVERILREARA